MAICAWCFGQYETDAMYHICPDGLTLQDRLTKSSQELAERRARMDRLNEYNKATGENIPLTQSLAKRPRLPEQPNTVERLFQWNEKDLLEAKRWKIGLVEESDDQN